MSGYNKRTWNYDHPDCLWEEWTWWIRWPMAIIFFLYFGGALLLPLWLYLLR